MVDITSYTEVDKQEGTVSILWASLVSSLTGILAWANIQGYVSMIDVVWGGIATTIQNVGTWGINVVTQLTTLPADGLSAAFQANAQWLAQFGLVGQILAGVEVVLFLLIIYWTITKAMGVLL